MKKKCNKLIKNNVYKASDIKVSVCCMTYNHKDYVAQAIDSFLQQKTNFKYEIVIHDDCSTDGTVDILKKYQEKYPDIINVIFEKENQYSKKKDILSLMLDSLNGKYVALCEGDDYWCDVDKLQLQYNYIESHNECSLITNRGVVYNDRTKKSEILHMPFKGSRYYLTEEVILGGGGLFVTNSMFFKKEYLNNLPEFYYKCPVGDYPLTIYLSLCGKVYYIDKPMSVYRTNALGSWSSSQSSGTNEDIKNKTITHLEKILKMFNLLNNYTNLKYNYTIRKVVLLREYKINLISENYLELKKKKYKEVYCLYRYIDFKDIIFLFMIRNFCFLYKLYRRLKKR